MYEDEGINHGLPLTIVGWNEFKDKTMRGFLYSGVVGEKNHGYSLGCAVWEGKKTHRGDVAMPLRVNTAPSARR